MLGLLLPVRQDLYVLDVAGVLEVLELAGAPTPLPGAPPALLGLINVRGQVTPVLDTAVLLDLPPLAPEERAAMVVVRVTRGVAALVTTARPRAEELGEELGASGLETATVRRRVGTLVAAVLDLEATLAPERVGR